MNLAYSLLVSTVWFLSIYFVVVFLLILIFKKNELFTSPKTRKDNFPKVSLVISAWNEEKTIADSIKSLNKIDYPKDKIEIVIVNDGSKDNTSKIVRQNLQDNIIFIDNKVNKGKAACLNQGILKATGELVACMDADSEVSPDAIKKLIPYFDDKKMGAVTVAVRVKNPKNFLEKILDIEYIIGLSLSLKALSFLNAVHVTPGPFSIYSRDALIKIGMFDATNMTEDLEIAYRFQKHGYKIDNCTTTKVWTITPNTFKSLYKQRKRWYTGALITLKQHKDVIFNKERGTFGFVVPYTYILIALGLFLFYYAAGLSLYNMYKTVTYYWLTNFNFHWVFDFDMLSINSLTFLGISSILATVTSAAICLKLSKQRITSKLLGMFGYVFIFFMYQVFWTASFYSFIFGRKVKWR